MERWVLAFRVTPMPGSRLRGNLADGLACHALVFAWSRSKAAATGGGDAAASAGKRSVTRFHYPKGL